MLILTQFCVEDKHHAHKAFLFHAISVVLSSLFCININLSSMDTSFVPESGILEKVEVHNLLSQLCCCLFSAQALGFFKLCFNPSV